MIILKRKVKVTDEGWIHRFVSSMGGFRRQAVGVWLGLHGGRTLTLARQQLRILSRQQESCSSLVGQENRSSLAAALWLQPNDNEGGLQRAAAAALSFFSVAASLSLPTCLSDCLSMSALSLAVLGVGDSIE
uniref:Uncharacterized protein n=1 Tax=Vitrella brassicaformis TaxID=1169539 RepID=A0A6U4B2D6_9ALVE|mmetsp:Transcript_16756/g.40201  ORF Transcript_16756/g.40201 Transcript_16756/m.40201 type:complete len:132 (+) Transcript_16756:210-605(+)